LGNFSLKKTTRPVPRDENFYKKYQDLKSTTSGQAHEVFKGNYFKHFEASLGELNPWLSPCD